VCLMGDDMCRHQRTPSQPVSLVKRLGVPFHISAAVPRGPDRAGVGAGAGGGAHRERQGGGTPALQRYRELFDDSMEGMINVLVQQSKPSGMVYVADYDRAGPVHKMDHLACFIPGMLALGARGDNAVRYLTLAQQLMYTCVRMYFDQPTGLAPEFVWFRPGQDMVSAEAQPCPVSNLPNCNQTTEFYTKSTRIYS